MKRWFAIHLRRWGGKYTHNHAEEWQEWRQQWAAYQRGDPVSQMVRGTWRNGDNEHQ